jgi:carbon monoxide dehydrogenase subunit G
MQLHLDGTRTINADIADVFARLTSPDFIAASLPDSEEARVTGPDDVQARMKVRIAVVSSTLNVKMTIADRSPPTRARLLATASGSGSSMKIDSLFELSGPRPTEMKWSADAEITGVMAGLGSTLLRGYASKKVGEIFDGITKAIEGTR